MGKMLESRGKCGKITSLKGVNLGVNSTKERQKRRNGVHNNSNDVDKLCCRTVLVILFI